MEIFVLFMFLSTGEIKTQEFNSKEACIFAAQEVAPYSKISQCGTGKKIVEKDKHTAKRHFLSKNTVKNLMIFCLTNSVNASIILTKL